MSVRRRCSKLSAGRRIESGTALVNRARLTALLVNCSLTDTHTRASPAISNMLICHHSRSIIFIRAYTVLLLLLPTPSPAIYFAGVFSLPLPFFPFLSFPSLYPYLSHAAKWPLKSSQGVWGVLLGPSGVGVRTTDGCERIFGVVRAQGTLYGGCKVQTSFYFCQT